MTSELSWLFVYGTLMSSFENEMAQYLQSNAKFISRAHTHGKLYRVSWFPGFIPDQDLSSLVWGELYKLQNSDKVLPMLDNYEGFDPATNTGEFKREQIEVFLVDGRSKICWTYVYNSKVDERSKINSGDFLNLNKI